MRLLHLIDGASPQATGTTLALLGAGLRRLGDIEEQVVLLGGEELRQAAGAAGVRDAMVLGVPFGRAVLGWPAIRACLRSEPDNPASEIRRPDVVHCWSLGAFTLATLAWPTTPRLLTLTVPPTPREAQWLRFCVGEAPGRARLLPISNTLQRAVVVCGIGPGAVQVLRPGIDLGMVEHHRRAALREGWGVEESDLVIALVADPPWAADALAASMAVGLAEEVVRDWGVRLRVLWHPRVGKRSRALAVSRDADKGHAVIDDARLATPWQVLAGCDGALAMGPHAGGLSLLWAMAANVPVVSHAAYAVSEVVEHDHSALLGADDQPRALAQRLTQLLGDRHLAWRLRDTARHDAYQFFSRQRYCEELGAAYRGMLSGAARPEAGARR